MSTTNIKTGNRVRYSKDEKHIERMQQRIRLSQIDHERAYEIRKPQSVCKS